MSAYNGAYRGLVIETSDPLSEHRIQVQVPDVLNTDHAWATAADIIASLPAIGDTVTIHFERGDENKPIRSLGVPAEEEAHPAQPEPTGQPQYHASYRGTVINNIDPGGYRRLAVEVPDVSHESMWAMPENAFAALPAIGDEVVVRFQHGDVQHPQWSGGSGRGEGGGHVADGKHARVVINNHDPEGLGRLYVSVSGVTEGVWATPSVAPPAVGDSVSVTFDGGSAEHAHWSR